jgi:hypothetical protein
MKAFLIDPFNNTKGFIDIDATDYKEICKAIHAEYFDCAYFQFEGNNYVCYVDDVGLITNNQVRDGYLHLVRLLGDDHRLYAGRVLITGYNYKTGDTTPARQELEYLRVETTKAKMK